VDDEKGYYPALQNFEVIYANGVEYMMTQPGVTIMICCHNGAGRLPETLRHIANQSVPRHILWEVLIVDNKSTDFSAVVARREWARYHSAARFRIVLEPTLGLSHARARGFSEAMYEYVIMCDDDNWLAPDYVEQVYNIMTERNHIGALGGFGILVFEIDPPRYIEQSNIFAAGEQAPGSGKVKANKIYGAGCVIRKSAYQKLQQLGFKSMLTDRKGRELTSGGDYELCYALALLGYDIWYDERLRFTHFITQERLNWEYFIRYARESAQCFEVLAAYKSIADESTINKISLVHILRNFFYTLRRFLRINTKRLVVSKNSDEARMLFFRHTVMTYKLATYLGRFSQMISIHKNILKFKRTCEAANVTGKFGEQPVYKTDFGITSFSKPSRQLR
jgi:glycosyltransferase involved in cell wall biosynthesis